jgi:transposase-like protein
VWARWRVLRRGKQAQDIVILCNRPSIPAASTGSKEPRAPSGDPGFSFPQPLRAFAVRYLAYALEKGDTVKAVVERLGVSEPTLQAWRRGQTPGGKKTQSSEPRGAPLMPVVVQLTVAELSLFLEGCELAGRHPRPVQTGLGALLRSGGLGLNEASSAFHPLRARWLQWPRRAPRPGGSPRRSSSADPDPGCADPGGGDPR